MWVKLSISVLLFGSFLTASPDDVSEPAKSEATYIIIIKTSNDDPLANTKSEILLKFRSQDGEKSTPYFLIKRQEFTDSEDIFDNVTVTVENVGFPGYIEIELKHVNGRDEWYCEYIEVASAGTKTKVFFPVYSWVVNKLVVASNAELPQKITSRAIVQLRAAEVEKNKQDIQWAQTSTESDLTSGLPCFLNATTPDELPYTLKGINTKKRFDLSAAADALRKMKFGPIKNLEDYRFLNTYQPTDQTTKNFLNNWKSDEAMGRQVLTGINPLMLKKCMLLPPDFNVKNEDVSAFLGEGTMLETEMAEGRIFIVDFKQALGGIVNRFKALANQKLYCPTPYGLFHKNQQGKFMPIAIQLVSGDRDYLYTPADNSDDWLLAKMYYRCADHVYQQWVSHLSRVHLMIEPICVAMERHLSKQHPLHQILRYHCRGVLEGNIQMRPQLLSSNSLANQIVAFGAVATVRKAYETFHIDDLNIPKSLKKQGTDDPGVLPNYYYRDDALALWKIMKDYLSKIIRHYYSSDADVTEDFELQSWVNEAAKQGFGWQDKNTRGMPETIDNVDQLIELFVSTMFSTTVQRAAVTLGQMDTYKFAPNSPSGMRLPPHRRGEATKERILHSLPDAFIASGAIAVTHALSSFLSSNTYLGQFPERLFNDETILKFQEEFRKKLEAETAKIKRRNANLKHPYTWLLPNQLPI
ncbi:unnamed protein product [Clavelina lepadiformis]|uniref:Uncharacterized protein n=1 Tax=Clavelina lepadiformis TaxID=159417 RepID=A0ABP0FAR8_CLALP